MSESYGIKKLREAIQAMRDACDDAERALKYDDPEITLANRVQHALVWGLANASMGVEICLANAQRAWDTERVKNERS